MSKDDDRIRELLAENERLKSRLQESEEVLDAIRFGRIDAVVVSSPHGDQVYTLTGSDQVYRILFETMNEGAATLDSYGTVFFCNARLSSILKTPMETILGGSILRFVTAEDSPSFESLLKRGLEEHQETEFTLQSQDGNSVSCHISTSPLQVEDSSHICMIVTDITDRKKPEEALHRLNRELRAISNCNQVLLRAADEQTLLNEICRIICDEAGYRLAWVGYAENDGAKTIRPVAWAGFDRGYIADAKLSWADDTERGRGPAGTVIRSGETVCVQDFTTDRQMVPWRESAFQRGYRSGIALPLKDENTRVFGVLLIYHSEPNAMTPNEIQLMEDLAGDLAFGIRGLRARIERKKAEDALRENEERLSLALEVSNAGTWEWNIERDEVCLDARFHEMLGYTPGELPNTIQEWLPYHHPGDMPIWMSKAQTYLRGDSPIYESEHRIRNKTGTWNWVFTRGKLVDITTAGSPKRFTGMAIDITDRKRAEETLRESEEKYRTLFEESFDGLFITSPGGKILDMNKKGVAMFGYDTKEEILRLDLERDVYAHPPDRKRILSMVNEQGTAEYEVVVKKKSGEEMITHCALTAVKDERGVITSYRGIIRDITARRLAEEALRTSEVQLSNAVMIAHLGPWEYDVTKDLFTFNDHFYKLFRTTAEQVGGYTMSSAEYARRFVHPDDMSVVGNEIRKSIEATDPDFSEKLEHRIVYADGEIGHISVRIFLVKDEFDRTVRTYGVNQDITERKRAEEALQEASSYNRSLIEASLDPLVTISAEGKITDVNSATERVTGYSRDELIGTDFADYFTDPQKSREGYQRAFKEGEVKDYELKIRHRDGGLTAVMYNASVYHDRYGEIVGLFAAARDISERKISEELIRVRLNLLEFAASHPLDELLQKALDEIGALTNSPIGFYHFVESDQKTLFLQAWSTRTVKEFCKAEGKGQHYSIDRV